MRVEQALYGEYRGGHSLLAASEGHEVARGIVQRLDLPDTAPPGVEWSPFLRGFPYGDRYVLARTFRDSCATRGGMVLSHALLAPLEEMAKTRDLRPLLTLLTTSDRPRPDVRTMELVRTGAEPSHSDELMGAAEAFGMMGQLPIVRVGHMGFDELVVALWAHLMPAIRSGFAFRLSFDPRDLVESPVPALVCTPQSMVARWRDYRLVGAALSTEPVSLVAAVLSGHAMGARLCEFTEAMGSEPATIRDLWLIEQAYLLQSGEAPVEQLIAATRLIEKLSPASNAGPDGKEVLLGRLCALVPSAGAKDILLLRNLELSGFSSASQLWGALRRWAAQWDYPREEDGDALSVLDDARSSTAAVAEWRTAVLDGLSLAMRSRRGSVQKAFWRWIAMHPDIVGSLFPHVPTEARVEDRLAAAVPRRLPEVAAASVATVALARRWLRLHGAVLSASCTPLEAVRRQVAVDGEPSFADGLRWAVRAAEPAEVIACALDINDSRLARFAGEAVAQRP